MTTETAEKKPVTHYLRLKENHPTMVKLLALYDKAEELGLHISFSHGGSIVYDRDLPDNHPCLYMKYEDSSSYENGVTEWPPTFGFNVTFENPKWREQKDEEARIWREKQEAERAEQVRLAEEARLERENAVRLQTEISERQLLATLKAKYEGQ
jgi:hypothetical protein